jgi:hypothetical protein
MNFLVLSATASAINFKNSLRADPKVRLFLTDRSKFASGLYGEGVVPFVIPPARDLDRYQAALDRIIAEHSIAAMVPSSDHDMEGVMELLRRGWNPPVKMFRPDYDVYRTLSHKGRLINYLRRIGFNVPRVYNHIDEVKYPVVIKPSREGGSKGVWIATSERELIAYRAAVERLYGSEIVIQQFIPGGPGTIYIALLLYGQDGNLYGEVASHSHLTFMTWGGGGNAGIVVYEPKLLEEAKRIVEAAGGWKGPINLEFKKHSETGHFYLMEANCRLNGYSYLTTMNGLNFPRAIVDLLFYGTTDFLSLHPSQKLLNFIMSFREKTIDTWIGDAD